MTPSGWNYNLTKRCIKTTRPGEANYYEDLQQCDPPPILGIPSKHWTLAIQSEHVLSVACPGPENQCFPINTGGPITLDWLQHADEFGNPNWSVGMKTDLYNYTHPCGENCFNWYMFMDHISEEGGPLPVPDKAQFRAIVNYNDFCPNGAARVLAMFQGYWNGKQRMVELHFQSTNWGDTEPANPIIVTRIENESFQYLAVHGEYFGIQVPKMRDTSLTVPWDIVLNTLVDQEYLPAPDELGWSTQAIGIGHEVHNWTPSFAAIAALWFTNFRIEEV